MGCTSSISYKQTSCKHLNTYTGPVKSTIIGINSLNELAPAERHIVRRTWPTLVKDIQGNGLQVFLRIFELCPEVKELFYLENVRLSEIARNVIIKAHGARFISAIGAAVDNLDDFDQEDNKLCRLLFILGQQHKRYTGFKPEYFEVFYEALMWQWERCMGDQFTPEVSDTWSHVFVYILEKLKEGYFSNEVFTETQLDNR
ncbi:neuroglobin-like [Mercenaria mercenaria]|uniref:neuroglobin-like n=1 Tax=Mercenaria mercenaria TaxID=6596 RepID=UPI00234F1397|nr:neuroglobin-like [Mercenaria mercenaria]